MKWNNRSEHVEEKLFINEKTPLFSPSEISHILASTNATTVKTEQYRMTISSLCDLASLIAHHPSLMPIALEHVDRITEDMVEQTCNLYQQHILTVCKSFRLHAQYLSANTSQE